MLRSIGQSVGRSVGRSIRRSVGRSVGRSVEIICIGFLFLIIGVECIEV